MGPGLAARRLEAFDDRDAIATLVAMVFNFELNNVITYADQRLKGPRLWRGLLLFMLVCGVGAVANVGIAKALYYSNTAWSVAGVAGPLIVNAIADHQAANGKSGADLYSLSLYIMVGVLIIGLIANLLIRPVNERFHEPTDRHTRFDRAKPAGVEMSTIERS